MEPVLDAGCCAGRCAPDGLDQVPAQVLGGMEVNVVSNPVFNERTVANWAPPGSASEQFLPPLGAAPVSDGPVSPWSRGVMTVSGTVSAAAVLLSLLLVAAVFGWFSVSPPAVGADGSVRYGVPGVAWVGVAVGVLVAVVLAFKPALARVLAPVYALAQGFFVGAVSRVFEEFYDGIVIQAAGVTIAVAAVMLALYRAGVIRVTARFRRIVVTATLGVMVFYLVAFGLSLLGAPVSFLASSSLVSVGFSVLVAGLAAANLALDFDLIETGARRGLPKHFEWFAAFGLLVTLVWLYLEMLRLLAKLRER